MSWSTISIWNIWSDAATSTPAVLLGSKSTMHVQAVEHQSDSFVGRTGLDSRLAFLQPCFCRFLPLLVVWPGYIMSFDPYENHEKLHTAETDHHVVQDSDGLYCIYSVTIQRSSTGLTVSLEGRLLLPRWERGAHDLCRIRQDKLDN